MGLDKLNAALVSEIAALEQEGRAKAPERVIVGYVPPSGARGPRYRLQGSDARVHPDEQQQLPVAVASIPRCSRRRTRRRTRSASGPAPCGSSTARSRRTSSSRQRIARFVGRPAARVFNSAYTTMLGLAITLSGPDTFWIGDALNHNCIIRAMRIANVPSAQRAIFKHNDVADLDGHLARVPDGTGRVIVIFDGIFSMRGDHAPLDEIAAVVARHESRFRDGIVTVMDDSHGIAAYGATGRGTEEHCGARVDIFIGTFGKAFGVNGGFVAGSPELIEAVRQKADTYIYTNPLGAADCAAAVKRRGHRRRRRGAGAAGQPDGAHAPVPRRARNRSGSSRSRARTRSCRCWCATPIARRAMVRGLFERGILAVGLTFPVVPRGDETIRFQINAAHTADDIGRCWRR